MAPSCQPAVWSAAGAAPSAAGPWHSGKSGGGLRCCVSCSYANASRIRAGSPKGRPRNCSPAGSPSPARVGGSEPEALSQQQGGWIALISTDKRRPCQLRAVQPPHLCPWRFPQAASSPPV